MTCGKILIFSPHQCAEIFDTFLAPSWRSSSPTEQTSTSSNADGACVTPVEANALAGCVAGVGVAVRQQGVHWRVSCELGCVLAYLASHLHAHMTSFKRRSKCSEYLISAVVGIVTKT